MTDRGTDWRTDWMNVTITSELTPWLKKFVFISGEENRSRLVQLHWLISGVQKKVWKSCVELSTLPWITRIFVMESWDNVLSLCKFSRCLVIVYIFKKSVINFFFFAKTNTVLLLCMYHIFIFLLSHLHIFWNFYSFLRQTFFWKM